MALVIDANIVAGHYKETVLCIAIGLKNNLTASTVPLFNGLGANDTCYLDEGTVIENEWRAPVSPEWFDAWFSDLLASGKAQIIPARPNQALEKRLRDKGFPQARNRDMWYVRTCCAVLQSQPFDVVRLITEDIDFYDPTKKLGSAKTRRKTIEDGGGPVRKLLKKEAILVTALCHD